MWNGWRLVFLLWLLLVLPARMCAAEEEKETLTFPIREIILKGNTLFNADQLQSTLAPFIGAEKTAGDVEKARSAVETFYHQRGYPTALVNIPRQTVESGTVRLEVIESKVRRVRVKGNRYFTRERLLKEMPAFQPGEILFLPAVKQQLARVNRNPDLKVAPILMPGKKLGTIDVEFRVKDKLPLHGSLELNNRASHDTTHLRLNGSLRYDNLWQKEHSLSLQYQTSPEDADEVQLITGSYSMPSPLDDDHMLVLYGLHSDSDVATADGFTVVGKGEVYGLRYLANLPPLESYLHTLTLGVDSKNFLEDIENDEERVRYLPFHMAYTGIFPDKGGQTRFSTGINVALRSMGSDVGDFEKKRLHASGNYVVFTAELERRQKLGKGWHLMARVDGQTADQPLISNEQYTAGGMDSVRGYKESESSGDEALHATVELSAPDLGPALKLGDYLEMTPYLFYDGVALRRIDPAPGMDENTSFQGAGAGVRGHLFRHISYRLDWATALDDTQKTDNGSQRFYFKVAHTF